MSSFRYDESCHKDLSRPRHPFVCYLDVLGFFITLIFILFSNSISVQIYLLSLLLLYFVSTVHHWSVHSDLIRRLDHMMIFVVIVMTATPYWTVVIPFPWKPTGWIIMGIVLSLGIISKVITFFPKWLSALIYGLSSLPMIIYFVYKWDDVLPPYSTLWILGVCLYGIQLAIYTLKWCDFKPEEFGFREVQHIVLLAATTLHSYVAISLAG